MQNEELEEGEEARAKGVDLARARQVPEDLDEHERRAVVHQRLAGDEGGEARGGAESSSSGGSLPLLTVTNVL